MIKFFRRIRYDLMENNKTGKPALPAGRYLKYAIGEIVLVVIGILIALQINNWNQNRHNKDLESQYYKRLLDDVSEEKLILEASINYSERVSFHAKKAIAVFENASNASINPIENLIDMYQASQYADWYSASSTFKELIASGQINLLHNDSLKTALIRYYDAEWSESGVFKLENKYRENLRGKMPDEIQTKLGMNCGDIYLKNGYSYLLSLPNECNIDLDLKIAKSVVEELRRDESLRKDLGYLIANEVGKINYLKTLQNKLNVINNLLEKVNNN